MIKKLKVKNYKSLRDVEIELDKFTVLIGPNASGKSNILDALMFLSDIAKLPLDQVITQRGGFEHIVFGGEGQSFDLSVDLIIDNQPHDYDLRIENKIVNTEQLKVDGTTVLNRNPVGVCDVLRHDNSVNRMGFTQNETALYYLNQDTYIHSSIRNVLIYFKSWKLYQISASDMRRPIQAKRNFNLEKNGANIAQVLISLRNERPKLFDRIQDILKQGIPEVDELLTPLTTDGNTYIAIREKSFTKEFDYYQLSDGTIKLLAYITAVILPESNVICFEEPENFIHPRLLQLLVEVLKKSEKQVILSTHSPYFIDFVEPEDIRLVEKVKGETKVSKISDPEKLKEALKEIELGELWYSGQFGGTR